MNFEEFRADATKCISELETENEALKKLSHEPLWRLYKGLPMSQLWLPV